MWQPGRKSVSHKRKSVAIKPARLCLRSLSKTPERTLPQSRAKFLAARTPRRRALMPPTSQRSVGLTLQGDQRDRIQFILDMRGGVCDENMVRLGLAILGFEESGTIGLLVLSTSYAGIDVTNMGERGSQNYFPCFTSRAPFPRRAPGTNEPRTKSTDMNPDGATRWFATSKRAF